MRGWGDHAKDEGLDAEAAVTDGQGRGGAARQAEYSLLLSLAELSK